MHWLCYPNSKPTESSPKNKTFYYVQSPSNGNVAYKCWYRGGSWLCDSLETVISGVTHFTPATRNAKTRIELEESEVIENA